MHKSIPPFKIKLGKRFWRKVLPGLASLGLLFAGLSLLWITTVELPDVSNFNARVVAESTKFFDRTGKVLLFNTYENVRRTEVPLSDMSHNIKNATVAIEDSEFYQHNGIKPKAILRAVISNTLITLHLSSGYTQGGSTITQQVVKNALLTKERSIPRKVKEWVLAIKLEKVIPKDRILEIYLNENPYGGNLYGIEEASQTFFGVSALNLTLAQSAYLAAIPQAPTYYSPYGNHRDALESRKNLVLSRMKELGFITEKEYNDAQKEIVEFLPPTKTTALAPHFIFYLRDYLAERYGDHVLDQGGLNVITTIDADLQKKAEETVKKYALENSKKFDAENAAMLVLDPKTGQILAMVGSRDFFDKEIDGNFNIIMAKRQPGSAFKPFVYATAFKKGYTDKTVVFDVKTEFSARCTPDSKPLYPTATCYSPDNFDNKFHGPMTLREALAQSMNVPAVKTLYLAGMSEALKTANDMGITTLNDPERLGLTLVLGGGEVSLLELTSAYSGFANDGVRSVPSGILKITGSNGDILEEYKENSSRGIDQNIARTISSILSDNRARAPAFGEQNALNFGDQIVAAKTGTTNDYRDAWVVGYTPTLTVGAWAGNNNNRPMQKKVAGQIVAPMWHEFMNYALSKYPSSGFSASDPIENENSLPPVLRGSVQRENGVVHDILYWVDKDNPRGGAPTNPQNDPQFPLWEYGVERFMSGGGEVSSNFSFVDQNNINNSIESDGVIRNFPSGKRPFSQPISFSVASIVNGSQVSSVSVNFNGRPISNYDQAPFYISFNPQEIAGVVREENTIHLNIKTLSGDSINLDKSISIDLNR